MNYRAVELKEGVLVQFVGVHVVRWQFEEWGEPQMGFVEDDTAEELLEELVGIIKKLAAADFLWKNERWLCGLCGMPHRDDEREDWWHEDSCLVAKAQAALAKLEATP